MTPVTNCGPKVIGDRFWRDGLWERYQLYVAKNEIPQSYAVWAPKQAWKDFARLARLVLAMPEFTLADWETHNPLPMITGQRGNSVVLARKLVGAWMTVKQILDEMKEWDRGIAYAVRQYLGERGRWNKEKVDAAKPWVYQWLIAAAEKDK